MISQRTFRSLSLLWEGNHAYQMNQCFLNSIWHMVSQELGYEGSNHHGHTALQYKLNHWWVIPTCQLPRHYDLNLSLACAAHYAVIITLKELRFLIIKMKQYEFQGINGMTSCAKLFQFSEMLGMNILTLDKVSSRRNFRHALTFFSTWPDCLLHFNRKHWNTV